MFTLENICSGFGITTVFLMFYLGYHYGRYEWEINKEAGGFSDAAGGCSRKSIVKTEGNKTLEDLRVKALRSLYLLILFFVVTMAFLMTAVYRINHVNFWFLLSAFLAGFVLCGIIVLVYGHKLKNHL